MTETTNNTGPGARLDSWKEIADYLERDVSTVRRWERYEGLPVRRHEHQKRSSVYAIPAELDAWRAARQPEPEVLPVQFRYRRLAIAAAVAVTLLGSLWTLWHNGVLRLPYPLVEAAEPSSRRLWTGKVDLTSTANGDASTDGRLLVFTDWSTGDLAAIELATGQQRSLTHTGKMSASNFAQFPAISPDGRFVAYSWLTKNNYELRVVATAEGAEPRTLYSNAEVPVIASAGWSGDGKQLLVTSFRMDRTQQIAMLAVDSGALRVVKSFGRGGPGKLSLSPDGRYIAYDFPQKEGGPERDIVLLSSDGSREVPLVRHPGHDAGPMWTPDGSRVVFLSDRNGALGLWSVSVAEGRVQGEPALVQANASQMSPFGFSRNGGVHYSLPSDASDLLVGEIDLEAGRLLTEAVPVVSQYGRPDANQRPDWSPDGRYLAYVARAPSPAARGGPLRVVVRDMETGREREMSQGFQTLGTAPKWRPDGKTLLVYGIPADGPVGTMQLNVADGSASRLDNLWTGGCEYPQWSTTSDEVWCAVEDGAVRRQINSGEEKGRVEFARTGANAPLSGDGRWLVFQDKNRTLILVPIAAPGEGGERRELFRPESGNDCRPSWTPDSRYVLCTGGQVWLIPASGGEARKLTLPLKGLRGFRVHPGGKRVAMLAPGSGSELWVLENFLPTTAAAR